MSSKRYKKLTEDRNVKGDIFTKLITEKGIIDVNSSSISKLKN